MLLPDSRPSMPPAIVMARVLTGLSTVRALGRAGVPVYVVYFDPDDPVRLSRYAARAVWFDEATAGPEELLLLVEELARGLGCSPPVLPTSDRDALLLCAHRERLARVARLWTTSLENLIRVVRKDLLYERARQCGLPLIPACRGPSLADYEAWVCEQPGPYIVKTGSHADQAGRFEKANRVFERADMLLEFLAAQAPGTCVVQRVVQGGDGFIFDTYGLTSEDGDMRVITSHRRWRQLPPHFGATTFGEIPAQGIGPLEERMFAYTSRLLREARFHGIFGIEWLLDRAAGELYLIDFNARPFLSIGHLTDCGLNLPWLAYLDLIGRLPQNQVQRPRLKHRLWIDFARDLHTYRAGEPGTRRSLPGRLLDAARCRSFAYADWRDPLPALDHMARFLRAGISRARRIALKA